MRFGFAQVPREHYAKHVGLIKFGEELGFDFAWLTDQTFYRDPYVLLSLALEATDRIRVGIGVTNAYTRHPAITARAVGTMNELAPGRVHLGIGAGNRRELLGPLGIQGDHEAERIRETVEIWRRLLSGERTTFHGRHYGIEGVALLTAPAPEVPLYIGGRGPRILQTAGEVAAGTIIGGLCTPKGMTYALEHIEKGARQAQRDIAELDIVCWVSCFLTNHPQAKRESIKPWIAHFIGEAPQAVLEAVGLEDGTVQAIRSTYENGGSSAAAEHVTEDCIDQFSLVTDPEEGAARIDALRRAGVTQFCMLLPTGSVDEHRVQLEEFSETILPGFR
jgi:5,10-methylenetetrahydromethanopterin reductase